jgi:TRAP-type C4-dicarboxylate transport system substrate-binding protein
VRIRALLPVLLAVASVSSIAGAQTVLRMATVAPDGSAWAHECRALGRDVERRTNGHVRVKWYFGGIAGGDLEVGDRIRRGQLDGAASGGPLCGEVMPSMRVLQFPGLFQNASEGKYVVGQLAATLDVEAEQSGFVQLGTVPLGSAVYFSRHPVGSFADLRREKIWVWDAEMMVGSLLREMGLEVVRAPLERAAREFDAGRFDGFWALPTAAVAFQWSAQAPSLVAIHGEYLFACFLLSNRAFLGLPVEDQRQVRAAAAQGEERLDEVSRQQERALLAGAFQHQGVTVLEPNEKFRAEFFAKANAARDRLGPMLIPRELLQRVRGMLSDYRAEHQESTP